MLVFFNSILKFLKDPNNRTLLLLGLIVVICFLYFRSCEKAKSLEKEVALQEMIFEQNVRALNDSMRHVKNKAGEIEATRSAFIASVEDLKKLNSDLYAELKKEIGNVKSIVKAGVVYDNPVTASNQLIDYGNMNYGLSFEKLVDTDTLFSHIKGVSKFSVVNNVITPGQTEITMNKSKFNIVLGFKESDDNYEVFARSNNPSVEFMSLDGSLILPKNKKGDLLNPTTKPKRFGLGPGIGMGYGKNGLSPYVGLNLSYHVISW